MIDLNDAVGYLDTIKVVHGQIGRSLVFVTNVSKALGFESFVVANKIDIHDFAVPKHNQYI
jgi:hypothetical protein